MSLRFKLALCLGALSHVAVASLKTTPASEDARSVLDGDAAGATPEATAVRGFLGTSDKPAALECGEPETGSEISGTSSIGSVTPHPEPGPIVIRREESLVSHTSSLSSSSSNLNRSDGNWAGVGCLAILVLCALFGYGVWCLREKLDSQHQENNVNGTASAGMYNM